MASCAGGFDAKLAALARQSAQQDAARPGESPFLSPSTRRTRCGNRHAPGDSRVARSTRGPDCSATDDPKRGARTVAVRLSQKPDVHVGQLTIREPVSMRISLSDIHLERVTFSAGVRPSADRGSVEMTLAYERGTSVRLTAEGTGEYAFSITFVAEFSIGALGSDEAPSEAAIREAVARESAAALLPRCRDEIARLTQQGRFGVWAFDEFDVNALFGPSIQACAA